MQWQTAIANAASVQHVFVSSFNEFIAQPQANPFPQPHGVSMGLEWDPARTDLWVDSFGCHLSRDIEPSVQCGNATYDMMLSCIRTMTLVNYLWASHDVMKTALPVAERVRQLQRLVANEKCASSQNSFENVWSLRRSDGGDYLVTTSPDELQVLLSSGNWKEVCNGFGGPTQFCVDGGVLTEPDASTGPFLLSNSAVVAGGGGGFPLYRCRTSGGLHFFTNQSNCEGMVLDNFLGYSSGSRTTDFPRSLRRCYRAQDGVHYHSLDFSCNTGDTQEAEYGYVH
jgi:hypothetical protein